MGATPVADIPDQGQLPNGSADMPSPSQAGAVNFRPFEVLGLASDPHNTPTGMREDLVLLSWLIVLLRTREDSQVCFDWTYQSASEQKSEKRCLSMNKVMTGLQDRAGKVAAAILDDIETVALSHHVPTAGHVSLVLSTGNLSRTSEEPKEEVSEWLFSAMQIT